MIPLRGIKPVWKAEEGMYCLGFVRSETNDAWDPVVALVSDSMLSGLLAGFAERYRHKKFPWLCAESFTAFEEKEPFLWRFSDASAPSPKWSIALWKDDAWWMVPPNGPEHVRFYISYDGEGDLRVARAIHVQVWREQERGEDELVHQVILRNLDSPQR